MSGCYNETRKKNKKKPKIPTLTAKKAEDSPGQAEEEKKKKEINKSTKRPSHAVQRTKVSKTLSGTQTRTKEAARTKDQGKRRKRGNLMGERSAGKNREIWLGKVIVRPTTSFSSPQVNKKGKNSIVQAGTKEGWFRTLVVEKGRVGGGSWGTKETGGAKS